MRRINELAISAAAADKMNDFQFVAIFKYRGLPLGAGDDFQIQLHGHAVGLHAELCDQSSYGKAVRKFALFAIDVESHEKAIGFWPLALSLSIVNTN